jgi:hypothetical protein
MGEKIVEIYEVVTRLAGLKGRMQLAVKTGISRTEAQTTADSPDKLSKFKKEASEILGRDVSELLESGKK